MPWKGGKLTTLLHGRFGANALTSCVATVKNGEAKMSAATLRCASRLRQVQCYPLLNNGAAQGLLAINRSELIALKEDMAALAADQPYQIRGVSLNREFRAQSRSRGRPDSFANGGSVSRQATRRRASRPAAASRDSPPTNRSSTSSSTSERRPTGSAAGAPE